MISQLIKKIYLYFIFYTGINELLKTDYDQWDFSDGMAKLVEKDKVAGKKAIENQYRLRLRQ